jgi:hypothetical protein
MATIPTLVARNELVQLAGGLEPGERAEREMYAFPHVISWFDEVLPTLQPELSLTREHELPGGIQSPIEQVDDIVHDFISGADFDVYEKAHFLQPDAEGVWELKTVDVRLIGWFYKRRVFVIANADSAYRCKAIPLYEGYRTDTIRRRRTLDLDEPKYVTGGYSYVL